MFRRKIAIVLSAALIVGGALDAQEKRRTTLTAQDYAEIQQLYAAYAWAIDTKAENGMVYARTFTPDGEFHNAVGGTKFTGHAEIAALNRGKDGKPSPVPTHFTLNVTIEPSPEGAHGAAYLLITGAGQGAPPSVATIGTYKDVLVKTPEGWRFKKRTLYLNAMPPAESR